MTFRTPLAALALAAGLGLTGCDTIENVEPRQSVTPEQALDTVEGFEAILVNGYDALQDASYYGQQYILVPDALADNIEVPDETSNRYPGFTLNSIGSHINRWGGHYVTINAANLVLDQIDALEIQAADPEAIRSRIKGEAYFLRAINYFDLARTKAYEPGMEVDGFNLGVIIRTEPTASVEDADFRARSTNEEVYNLIVSDLNQAITLLDGTARGSINFASQASAYALLSRVQLYQGNWAEAEAAAQAALNATTATLVDASESEDALLAAFTGATNPEAIFEILNTPSTDGETTNVNSSLQSLTDPTRGGFFDTVPTESLLSAYAEEDARRVLFDTTASGIPYILKYTGAIATDVDPVPVIRVAEMYLTLAEARAEQGEIGSALEALNMVRNARGLDDFESTDADALIDEILEERRREFAFEGHRFFDLKRRGLNIPKPQISATAEIPYENFRILARIPPDQVDNNPELVQNPGYSN